MTPFLLCSYFPTHPTTLLLKILGGRMHGPSPHLKFFGDRPPVPLGLRLWHTYIMYVHTRMRRDAHTERQAKAHAHTQWDRQWHTHIHRGTGKCTSTYTHKRRLWGQPGHVPPIIEKRPVITIFYLPQYIGFPHIFDKSTPVHTYF